MQRTKGFTLIEVSIVLVIIGLIVGGVLVGRDLIKSAEIRSQITQIEQFNTAANTFKTKYGYLPGDLPDPDATSLGFPLESSDTMGDGNGLIAGNGVSGSRPVGGFPQWQMEGETTRFWNQLSETGLINGAFDLLLTEAVYTDQASITSYYPKGKIGENSHVFAWSGGSNVSSFSSAGSDGKNYFSVETVTSLAVAHGYTAVNGTPNMSVLAAYSIDSKIDDGMPTTGTVIAYWLTDDSGLAHPFVTTATAASTSTCFDNANTNGATQTYSIGQNQGNGINCALSFRFR